MAQPRIGESVLGRYRLVRQLCYGSIGTVFLAQEDGTEGHCIVKWILHSRITSKDALDNLKTEVDRMTGIGYAGIARPLAFGGDADAHFLVTEYSHGWDLGQWFALLKDRGEPFPIELAIHIAIEALGALHYAHTLAGEPIVHKDITPSNILIDVNGSVRVSDFGIARVVSGGTAVTDQSMLKKFAYLPPELVKNEPADARTDVYAVGLILHELIAGENPFAGGSLPATLTGIMTKSAPRIDGSRSDLPAGLADIVAKAEAKDINDRYASAREFADALEQMRTVPREQAAAQLLSVVQKDFHDPRMAELAEMPTLAERGQPKELETPGPAPMPRATSQADAPRMSEPRAPKKSSVLPLIAFILAALIVAGAVFVLMSD